MKCLQKLNFSLKDSIIPQAIDGGVVKFLLYAKIRINFGQISPKFDFQQTRYLDNGGTRKVNDQNLYADTD